MQEIAKQVLGLIDLTSLNDNDTSEVIIALCQKASTVYGNVPAICIYPRFIPVAKEYFKKHGLEIKIATVTNFPHGNDDLDTALAETKQAIDLGADEVDIVFPYRALMRGDSAIGAEMIKKAKHLCGTKTLKVIIESGELKNPELIKQASEISILAGADFIKTSTGKVAVNATLEASKIMLETIKKLNSDCGFKAAGGIKTVAEAKEYLELTTQIMGAKWIRADKFRFGASSLLVDVLNVLSGTQQVSSSAY